MTIQVEGRLAAVKPVTANGLNPFLAVTSWELRRMAARSTTWILMAAIFILTALLTWSSRLMNNLQIDNFFPIYVHVTSAYGALMFEGTSLVMYWGLLIPFVAADQVARDYRRRTHELLMSTPIPGWAYIWGRYLAGLLLGVALALLMLAGLLFMAVLLSLDLPLDQHSGLWIYAGHKYPAPNLGAIVLVWLSLVLPTLLLVYNLSFGLGTLLPRHAGQVKALCVFSWLLGGFYWIFLGENSTLAAWHLNYLQMSWKIQALYQPDYKQILKDTDGNSPELRLQIAHQVENKLFDIWTWQLPHLLYIGLGLALVWFVAARYQGRRGN